MKSLLILFFIAGFWGSSNWSIYAQEMSEQKRLAQGKYELARQENEKLASDSSNPQRQKTVKALKEAIDAYSQLTEQYPEITDEVTEEMVTLNSWIFWVRKFAPINFKEDGDEGSEAITPPKKIEKKSIPKELPKEQLDFLAKEPEQVKKIEPPPLKKETRPQKYPLETAYHFRGRLAFLLQNRRFFEASNLCQSMLKSGVHPQFEEELNQSAKEIESLLAFYDQMVDLISQTPPIKLDFTLINGTKLEGTLRATDEKGRSLVVEIPQGKVGIEFFMLSTDSLIKIAQARNALETESQGAIFYYLEGEYSKALKWFKEHSSHPKSSSYLKKLQTLQEQDKKVQSIEKERAKKFRESNKHYKIFNELLTEWHKEDYNKTLYHLSKLAPLLEEDQKQEMGAFLEQETQKNWSQLVDYLRNECTKCDKKRKDICSPCGGKGWVKNPPKFSSRPNSQGNFDCPKCRDGIVDCPSCFWRYQDPKAKEVEKFFPIENMSERRSSLAAKGSKKGVIRGKVQWGDLLCEEAKVMLVYQQYDKGSLGPKAQGTDVQTGGYFYFEVMGGAYELVYWKDGAWSRQPLFFSEPEKEVRLQLITPIEFSYPEENESLLIRPVFLQWEKQKEEYFVVKVFEMETENKNPEYTPVLTEYLVRNSLHLSKKQIQTNKQYIVLVSGYGGEQIMSQGQIRFSVAK